MTRRELGILLGLVVERISDQRNNWGRRANAERKRLEAIREKLEDEIIKGMRS